MPRSSAELAREAVKRGIVAEISGTTSYSTVRTQLRVLEEKGHVRHEEEDGNGVAEEQLVGHRPTAVPGRVVEVKTSARLPVIG